MFLVFNQKTFPNNAQIFLHLLIKQFHQNQTEDDDEDNLIFYRDLQNREKSNNQELFAGKMT